MENEVFNHKGRTSAELSRTPVHMEETSAQAENFLADKTTPEGDFWGWCSYIKTGKRNLTYF